jgi:hypothetical protein
MRTYLHPVTPAALSQPLIALCQEIAPGSNPPVYVDVRPLQGAPSKECFPIVENHIGTHGGASVIGWSLWEMPTLFVEAEFHAIWRSPDGGLLDIAPKPEPTKRILFLADPAREYQGRQVNNVRKPLRQDPIVLGFLRSCDDEFEFLNRGARAEQHEISLQGDEVVEYQQIQMRKAQFELQMMSLFPRLEPYSPCWCGSGKKAKWCHGVTQ